MIRNCSLEEISDGKLYSENDMVKADTNQCQGCNSVCCHGMGDSIVLDPYDICRLTRQLQMPFESLVEKHLALNVVDGVILPNLKMAGEMNSSAAGFTAQDRVSAGCFRWEDTGRTTHIFSISCKRTSATSTISRKSR